jgi:hypothetical protein
MRLCVISAILFLGFTTLTSGQILIRGTTKISTDGITCDSTNNSPNQDFERRIRLAPIDKTDSEIEIRLYDLKALSNTRNLKIVRLKDGKWTATEHNEWNKPAKIKKYHLKSTTDLESFTVKLLAQNLAKLPDQDQLRVKMKKFTEVNGRKMETAISVTDGDSYTVEFKLGKHFRIYQFDNPDAFARFYDNVSELKNYVAIKELFQQELTRSD